MHNIVGEQGKSATRGSIFCMSRFVAECKTDSTSLCCLRSGQLSPVPPRVTGRGRGDDVRGCWQFSAFDLGAAYLEACTL